MKTLSVLLIVKDEEPVLGRCLSCARQFADELIVVDTGSRDRSVKIAREYADTVAEHPWQNSFAEARNFAFSLGTQDFLMWMDADDVVSADNIARIQDLKRGLGDDVDVVFTLYRNGTGYLTDYALRDRMYRRELEPRWVGDVHEAVLIEKSWRRLMRPDIVITHQKEYVNDPKRNIRIFDGQLARGEQLRDYALPYLCRELVCAGRYREAEDVYRELKERHPSALVLHYGLVFLMRELCAQGRYAECAREIREGMERGIPPTAHLYYHLGLCCEKQGDPNQAYDWYKKATLTPEDPGTLMLQLTGYADYLSYLKLCALAWDFGRLDESREWNRLAGAAWPEGRAWQVNEGRLR